MSVHVKICGITTVADARLAVRAGADLIGLNFYPPSPRCVSETTAKAIRSILPQHIRCVGVFVNAERERIATYVRSLSLDAIQFHGDEDAAALTDWPVVATIKAVRVGSEMSLPEQLEGIQADYFLLDTYSPRGYGGTGETFAWKHAATLPRLILDRTILAGGLNTENVVAAVKTVRPWAVDVASGVESTPGRKDAEKLYAFINNAKTA